MNISSNTKDVNFVFTTSLSCLDILLLTVGVVTVVVAVAVEVILLTPPPAPPCGCCSSCAVAVVVSIKDRLRGVAVVGEQKLLNARWRISCILNEESVALSLLFPPVFSCTVVLPIVVLLWLLFFGDTTILLLFVFVRVVAFVVAVVTAAVAVTAAFLNPSCVIVARKESKMASNCSFSTISKVDVFSVTFISTIQIHRNACSCCCCCCCFFSR
mmetsp:Transcript_29174/g.33436  ORF Transcript_29174/g.33436 Transcript_29174/m.33436 type:complete len:214 (-) Transcript_29174:1096-1737(-)